MRYMQNSPKIGFHPYLRRSVLEDVCIYNNGILEVSTSRSTTSSSNSSNNNTTIISIKLICLPTNRSLHPTIKSPEDLPGATEPISDKKLGLGDGSLNPRKLILGWLIDALKKTLELPLR